MSQYNHTYYSCIDLNSVIIVQKLQTTIACIQHKLTLADNNIINIII